MLGTNVTNNAQTYIHIYTYYGVSVQERLYLKFMQEQLEQLICQAFREKMETSPHIAILSQGTLTQVFRIHFKIYAEPMVLRKLDLS